MKSHHNGGGPLDPPSGQVKVETPDGVSITHGGGSVFSNLMNAEFVSGGLGGGAFGGYPGDSEKGFFPMSRDPNRFRAG